MDLEIFDSHVRRTFPEAVDRSVMVAVSGGADSTALLHLLLRSRIGNPISAAHVHHGSRGAEADGDARFCATLCGELGIPFHRIDLRADQPRRRGREADWRTLRYEALESAAAGAGARFIMTAHHRDDIAEGVLLQLLRGAGPRAMAGIHARSGRIVRPLLPFSGAAIRSWLGAQDLAWREDSSNLDPTFLRNRVRHDVLPELERASPALRTHLVRLAQSLADAESAFATVLDERGHWIDPWHPEGGVPTRLIAEMPPALQIRWLHAQAARVGLSGVTHRQGALFVRGLGRSMTAITLNDRWTLRNAQDRLWLEPYPAIPPYTLALTPGEQCLPLPGWKVRVARDGTGSASKSWSFPVDDGARLTMRTPQPGDQLPNGRKASSVLRSFLPRHLRAAWPILLVGGKMAWIPGAKTDAGRVAGPCIVEVTHT